MVNQFRFTKITLRTQNLYIVYHNLPDIQQKRESLG